MHLGINDTDPRNWPNYRDEFVKDYLSIMDSLRAANPKVRIILARMTPIADRHPRFVSGTKQWHGEIQTAIETVARVSGANRLLRTALSVSLSLARRYSSQSRRSRNSCQNSI